MTVGYGNLSTSQATMHRSQNTRINDLPSSDEEWNRGGSGESKEDQVSSILGHGYSRVHEEGEEGQGQLRDDKGVDENDRSLCFSS